MKEENNIVEINKPIITGFYLGIGFILASLFFTCLILILMFVVGYNI